MNKLQSALLVEDEVNLAEVLKISLLKYGLEKVTVASTLADARQLSPADYDLILLDRMLPDGDGLELCLELRSERYKGVILVLTAAGVVQERVKGLDAGADDYLAKPFSWSELAARLRAIERRLNLARPLQPFTPSKVPAKDTQLWTCYEDRLEVLGPKGWVTLTPLELKLLKKLWDNENRIVSREELLKDVWGFQWLPKTRTVDFFLSRLRKLFEFDPSQPTHFISVRGVGYRFFRHGEAGALTD